MWAVQTLYILAESINIDRKIRIWDGIGCDNNKVRTHVAKMFAVSNEITRFKYKYAKNPKQIDGFECGDLCFAKAMELVKDNYYYYY